MPKKDDILIGEMLIDEGLITSEQLEVSLREQKKTGEFICTTLVKLGFAPEEKIFSVLSRQLNIPYVKLKDEDIEPLIIRKVSAKFASDYKIIPVEFKNNVLIIAMTDPLDIRTLDDIRLLLGIEVKGVLASELEIQEAIRKYYGVGTETLEKIMGKKDSQEALKLEQEKIEDIEIMAEEASVLETNNSVLTPFAIKAVKSASPFPPPPKSLEKEQETFKISLSYE